MIQGNGVCHKVTGYRDDTRGRREPFRMTSDFREMRQVWPLSRSAPGCAPRHYSHYEQQQARRTLAGTFWRWHDGISNE